MQKPMKKEKAEFSPSSFFMGTWYHTCTHPIISIQVIPVNRIDTKKNPS